MTPALPEFRIVPASRDDAALLARLTAESLDTGWREADFARFAGDPNCITLTARTRVPNPKILGFVLARAAADEAEILTVAVVPEARCRGVARKLLQRLVAQLEAQGVMSLYLEVAEDNHAAKALYRGLGFARAGTRANYYRGSEKGAAGDASILRLDLSPVRTN